MNVSPLFAADLSRLSTDDARDLGAQHAAKALELNPALATYDPPNLGVFPSPLMPANVMNPANWSWFFGNPRAATSTLAGVNERLGLKNVAAYWEGANATFLRAWHDAR